MYIESKKNKEVKNKQGLSVRNSKWLRTRSGVVKQRNTRIRRDWFRMKRTYMLDSYIVTLLMDKYNVSRRTVYNAVNDYYR